MTRRSTRKTKTITWPDGSVSIRYVSRNANREISAIRYKNSSDQAHRPDGKPAYISFDYIGNLDVVLWCENGNYLQSRLNAGLPTSWDNGWFTWESGHGGELNLHGPSRINSKGEQGFTIDDLLLDKDEFKQAYLMTHLEEYIDIDAEKLYRKLYLEMMECIKEELVMS